MDFHSVPNRYSPAYCWLWNTTVTREEAARQVDEMYAQGIRAFYVLGEPENFRPQRRRTHLKPDYLSPEYIDLLAFVSDYAKEKGMYCWLYNEGGFPSGMVCGEIVAENPDLIKKLLTHETVILHAGEAYLPDNGVLAGFCGGVRLGRGYIPDEDTEIELYRVAIESNPGIQSDNADPRNAEAFLRLTHDRLLNGLGDRMGSDLIYMFDDEAHMGSWSADFDRIFEETYGYDIKNYLPWVANVLTAETAQQAKAKIDYEMLCGKLVRDNYFLPMKRWLNAHGMQSVGHLDRDNMTDGFLNLHYGNCMELLRAFDVPGLDVIWSQISYPDENGKCCFEGSEFFPRIISSAARQVGSPAALSESFAVYGSHLTPDEMRFVVNYQAVRGINLFNFMVMSYDRQTAMSLQYRPNFIPTHVGMDFLAPINDYTARLSCILQNSSADIHTALYYPQRSLCAGGRFRTKAKDNFERLGQMLEDAGVCFDVIDELFVRDARVENGKLLGEHVSYEQIFVPEADFEPDDVSEKLSVFPHNLCPVVERTSPAIQTRRQVSADGVYYFVCSQSDKTLSETIIFPESAAAVRVDLLTGDLYNLPQTHENGKTQIPLSFLCGEGVLVFFPNTPIQAKNAPVLEKIGTIDNLCGRITRQYTLDENAPHDTRITDGGSVPCPGLWAQSFSGEVTYTATVDVDLPDAPLLLDLGSVRHHARVFVNDTLCGEAVMPPYRVELGRIRRGDTLKIVVANTIANAVAGSPYFAAQDIRDVGPYNENMQKHELLAPAGGLPDAPVLFAMR